MILLKQTVKFSRVGSKINQRYDALYANNCNTVNTKKSDGCTHVTVIQGLRPCYLC